jgi:signal transduction histidine kinase
LPEPRAEIDNAVLGTGFWEGELIQTHRDGEELVVASRWVLERDPRGRPVGVLQVDTDITARRRAEEAAHTLALAVRELSEASLHREQVLVTVATVVAQALRGTTVVWLLAGEHVLSPAAAATVDGQASPELRSALAVAPPSAEGGQHGLVLSSGETLLLRPPGPADQRITLGAPGEGAPSHIGSFLLAPLRARGQALGTLGTWRDPGAPPHSEHDRLLLHELAPDAALAIDNARLYGEAQEAIRIRDEVLNSVVHDLRGPLTAIVAESRLLERWSSQSRIDRDRFGRGLRRIENSAMRISGWIEELLDVARLEQGQPLTLRRGRVNLLELLEQAVADHQGTTADHTIDLDVPTPPPELLGTLDGPRLRRVLDNLLGNAIKYSPSGGIVSVRVERAERPDGPWAVVTVSDQGVGIPAEDQPYVFRRFHRGGNVVGRIEGTGIGLARAYQVVRQHGGEIELDSREGEGATFTLSLPLTSSARARPQSSPDAAWS